MAGTRSEVWKFQPMEFQPMEFQPMGFGLIFTHCEDRAPPTQAVRIPTGTLLVLYTLNTMRPATSVEMNFFCYNSLITHVLLEAI